MHIPWCRGEDAQTADAVIGEGQSWSHQDAGVDVGLDIVEDNVGNGDFDFGAVWAGELVLYVEDRIRVEERAVDVDEGVGRGEGLVDCVEAGEEGRRDFAREVGVRRAGVEDYGDTGGDEIL